MNGYIESIVENIECLSFTYKIQSKKHTLREGYLVSMQNKKFDRQKRCKIMRSFILSKSSFCIILLEIRGGGPVLFLFYTLTRNISSQDLSKEGQLDVSKI
jgi:hypothetical protein